MIRFQLPDEETLLLKETAERFVADRYELTRRNAMLAAPAGEVPSLWGEMAELGWLAAPVAEAAGGLGLSAAQVVPFLGVLGGGLVLEPIGPVAMHCASTLARALPSDTVEATLAPILAGESVEVIAAGAEDAPIRAVREGGDLRLSGVVPLLIGGAQASAFWVAAECDSAPLLVRIAADQADVEPFRLVDGQAAAKLTLDGVRCAASEAVMDCGAAMAYGSDMALVGNLAEITGLIDRLYRETLEYVKLREQFGRPIGRFQAVQHRMADLFIMHEEAQSMVSMAAEAMESTDVTYRARLVSAAQVKICDNARVVLRDAVQLHGGMGVTDELPVGHMVKRLLVLTRISGSRAAILQRFRKAA